MQMICDIKGKTKRAVKQNGIEKKPHGQCRKFYFRFFILSTLNLAKLLSSWKAVTMLSNNGALL